MSWVSPRSIARDRSRRQSLLPRRSPSALHCRSSPRRWRRAVSSSCPCRPARCSVLRHSGGYRRAREALANGTRCCALRFGAHSRWRLRRLWGGCSERSCRRYGQTDASPCLLSYPDWRMFFAHEQRNDRNPHRRRRRPRTQSRDSLHHDSRPPRRLPSDRHSPWLGGVGGLLAREGRGQQRADHPAHRGHRQSHRLRTSAGSHERFLVIEVFGRYAGFTALLPTMAGAADRCVIPEYPVEVDHLAQLLTADRNRNPSRYSVVLISEGATLTAHEA